MATGHQRPVPNKHYGELFVVFSQRIRISHFSICSSRGGQAMSVFNLITWWSGKVSDSGRQADGCLPPPVLCVSRFNSFNSATDSVERDTIFVGSATGMLSIYQPSDVHYITGHSSPTDVILEWQMRDPIIDLKCAKFAMYVVGVASEFRCETVKEKMPSNLPPTGPRATSTASQCSIPTE